MNPIELNKLDISRDLVAFVQPTKINKKIISKQSILTSFIIPFVLTALMTIIIKHINDETEKRLY